MQAVLRDMPTWVLWLGFSISVSAAGWMGRVLGRRESNLRNARGASVAPVSPSNAGDSLATDAARSCIGDDRDTRERLALLFEAAPVAMVIADLSTGRYVEVNPAYAQLLGYDREQMLGRTSAELQIWADPERYGRGLATLRAGGELRQEPSRFRRRDGEVLDVLLTVSPLNVAGIPHYFGAAIDVTHQQRALRDLNEAHERFSRVFENAPVAMAVTDTRDNTFVEVNAPFEALIGRTRRDILGRNGLQLDFWVDTALRSDILRRLQNGLNVQHQEARFRRADGTLLDVDYSGCAVEIAGRNHFVSMVHDVTVQRQARRALENQQQQLESLVAQRTAELETARATLAERAAFLADLYNGAPCGYHSLTHDGIIAEVNDTELKMLGYTRDEVLGQPLERFVTPESRDVFRKNFAELKRRGKVQDLEYELVRRDGSSLPVLVTAVLDSRDAGGNGYARATVVDNSERKEREREREALQAEVARRAEVAEAATRAKSAFLANMSHEIRTPLNAIVGATHLLRRGLVARGQVERLTQIEASADHLLSVINNILDLSKIEADKLDLESDDFELSSLVDGVRSMILQDASAKRLKLSVIVPESPLWLRGDAGRLRQAMLNLASNAVKFTERGSVTIRAELVAPSTASAPTDRALRFSVEDTGAGIDANTLNQLFTPFEQGDASPQRRYGGTGLGLAITRRLALLMGGDAGALSEPGRGSVFWFTARLAEGRARTASFEGMPRNTLRGGLQAGKRVLVVDDNAVNRDVAAELLRDAGLEAVCVENGALAVAAVFAGGIDLVLMDVQMPELDGLEATRRIRASVQGADVPIIGMSANVFREDRTASLAAGMNDFLGKPVNVDALQVTLTKWLASRSPAEEAPISAASPATGSDDNRILAHLVSECGVDPTRGVTNVGGTKARYCDLVRRFVTMHASDAERVAALVARGQLDNAREITHALRGVGSTLALDRLVNAAATLERHGLVAGDQHDDGRSSTFVLALQHELSAVVRATR